MPRTIKKLLPELGIAVAVVVVGFILDNPEVAAYAGPGGIVMLQALRRVLRDRQAKTKG